jgi:hypothetical protein
VRRRFYPIDDVAAPCGSVVGSAWMRSDADRVMLEIIGGRSPVVPSDRVMILAHLGRADFSVDVRTLREWAPVALERFDGLPHPEEEGALLTPETNLTSLQFHVLKHMVDGCWPMGATPAQYLSDIRASASVSSTIVDLGRDEIRYNRGQVRREAPRVALRVRTIALPPPSTWLVVDVTLSLYVIYDPDRARLLSGYTLKHSEAEASLARWKSRRTLSP